MKKPIIIHPYLCGISPVLFLFAHNIKEFNFSVIFLPIIVILSLIAFLLTVFDFIFRDKQKTSIVVSAIVTLLFSYSYFHNCLGQLPIKITGYILGPNKIIFLICGFFLLFIFLVLKKTRKDLYNITILLNIIFLTFIFISVINIGLYYMRNLFENSRRNAIAKDNVLITPVRSTPLPNIYYIILDAYTSFDVLNEIYHYDNSKFINYLKHKGFFVASESKSNYNLTVCSLPSSLNMEYIDKPYMIREKLKNNLVFRLAKSYGYKTLVVTSWLDMQKPEAIDFYLRYDYNWLNNFQIGIVELTPIPEIISKNKLVLGNIYDLHRKRIEYVFDAISNAGKYGEPFIIFAHIFAPHPPFVFNSNGEPIAPKRMFSFADALPEFRSGGGTPEEYLNGYTQQLTYVNNKIIEIIDKILLKEKVPPIIILQGDHGSRFMADWEDQDKTYFKECFSILNAYFLPEGGDKLLYDTISPVNTFRLIFNYYFGMHYALLKDKSYFFLLQGLDKFIDVTSEVNLKR